MRREEELMRAYEKARRGSKDYYEDLCTMLFDEVYKLVALVYEKESNRKKLVNHIFNKMRTRLNEFDATRDDIHRWVSVFSTGLIYSVYSMSNSDVFTYKDENAEFEIGHIEDDDEFADCAAHFNDLIARGVFDKSDSAFGSFTKGQVILYELFCYAGCTVEEIEEMLEVDSIYICSELCDIRNMLLTDIKAAGWGAGVSDDNEYDDNQDDDSDAQYDNSDNDDYPALDYEEAEALASSTRSLNRRSQMSFIDKIFEVVPEKVMKLIAMCIVALILIVILVMVLVYTGKDNGNNSNKNNNNINNQQQTQSGSQNSTDDNETEGGTQAVNNTAAQESENSGNNTESQSSQNNNQNNNNQNNNNNTQSGNSGNAGTTSGGNTGATSGGSSGGNTGNNNNTDESSSENTGDTETNPTETNPSESETSGELATDSDSGEGTPSEDSSEGGSVGETDGEQNSTEDTTTQEPPSDDNVTTEPEGGEVSGGDVSGEGSESEGEATE